MSAELDRMVLEERDRYREAFETWDRDRHLSDIQRRLDVTEELQAAERRLLEISKRRR